MKSLRGRLTVGITLVVAVVLALAGSSISRYVERSERGALDDGLQRTAELSRETAVNAIEQSLPDNDQRVDATLRASGTSVRILIGRSAPVSYGRTPPFRGATPPDGLRTITLDGRRYRSYVTPLRDASLGGLARLEVTRRLGPTEQRQRDLDRRLLALGGGALLLAAGGVWLAAGLLLRPLRRLRQSTSSIAGAEDLDHRVPGDRGPAELRSLAQSFNGMLSRLQRSSEDRERALQATRRFTADAGHELRTPLTTVQATLSALSRHPDIAPDRRDELVRDALAEHRRLVDLLDGLQAMARGDAAPREHVEVDLAVLVAVATDDASARHPDVTWETALPDDAVVVRGWEAGVRSLVDNLLENAARHGRDGGRVRAELTAEGELRVDDDGAGVAAAERERIFTPFARAEGTTTPGSGVGLALVAQQARAHGATVVVGDAPLGGARFSVRFAAVSPRPAPSPRR